MVWKGRTAHESRTERDSARLESTQIAKAVKSIGIKHEAGPVDRNIEIHGVPDINGHILKDRTL